MKLGKNIRQKIQNDSHNYLGYNVFYQINITDIDDKENLCFRRSADQTADQDGQFNFEMS